MSRVALLNTKIFEPRTTLTKIGSEFIHRQKCFPDPKDQDKSIGERLGKYAEELSKTHCRPSEWLRRKTNLALPSSVRDVEKLGHSCGVDWT